MGPEYTGFAITNGHTITIRGYTVNIDARALSHDLLPIPLGNYNKGFLPRASVNQLTLIPAAGYRFQPGSGIGANMQYTVDLSGNVVLDVVYAGFASASGNTLTIRGYTITIDGRPLSHDLLPIPLGGYTAGFLSRVSTHRLTLIPASGYTFQPGSGIGADMVYTVGVDGMVSFPASCNGFLAGQGTSTLTVTGYPVLIDATAADSNLVSLVNVTVKVEASRYVFAVLVPCHGYGLQTTNGIFSHGFSVERDGSITFDPAVTGKLLMSTIPRLEIHGPTPF